jgi:hypothetical protein
MSLVRTACLLLSSLTLLTSAHADDTPTPNPSASPSLTESAITGAAGAEAGEVSADAQGMNRRATRRSTWAAELVTEGPSIPNLTLIETQIPVTLVPNGGRLRPMIEIRIHYVQPGWVLFAQRTPIAQDNIPNEFTVFAYLKAKITEVTLTGVSPTGEMQSEKILIMAPQAQELPLTGSWGEGMAGVGFASFRYTQSGFGTFVSKTAIMTLQYTSPRWTSPLGLYAGAHMTMVTFSSNPINGGPQVLEAKLDATYLLNVNPSDRYQNKVLFGINYLTMFSNGSQFGFSNLFTPEIGFQSKYSLTPATYLMGEFRYAPAGNSLNLAQRGLDADITIGHALKALNRLELGVYYTNFAYEPSGGASVKANLFSIQLGYGF